MEIVKICACGHSNYVHHEKGIDYTDGCLQLGCGCKGFTEPVACEECGRKDGHSNSCIKTE